MSRYLAKLLGVLTWNKAGKCLNKNIQFCCLKHSWKCTDIASKTSGFVVTKKAGNVPMSGQKYQVLLPERQTEIVSESQHNLSTTSSLLPQTQSPSAWERGDDDWICRMNCFFKLFILDVGPDVVQLLNSHSEASPWWIKGPINKQQVWSWRRMNCSHRAQIKS